MKAAFHTGVKEITVREVPKPVPGPDQYLVHISHCAICGSDTWFDKPAKPNEPVHGHEAVGIIEACGANATRYKVGDRVVCYAIKGCGKCAYCKAGNPTNCQSGRKYIEGGFQQYALYEDDRLFPCPPEADSAIASLFSDAIGVPLRGLRRVKPEPDDKVCVWGLGPLGLLQVMFLKAAGVKTIIGLDTVDFRLKKALELGATHTVNPAAEDPVAAVRNICGGIGADKAYTYVRNDKATETVFKCTKECGTICSFVGLNGQAPINMPEYMERTLVWSFYFTPNEYEDNMKFIRDHHIDLSKIVTHIVPLDRINEGFLKRFDYQSQSLKVVISME